MSKVLIDTLTLDELKYLIANADDLYDNQIRVKKNGEVFISRTVGADNIEELQFRFETFDAGNDYVGINAASDEKYVQDIFDRLKSSWAEKKKGYID